jgi:hypothetical protein
MKRFLILTVLSFMAVLLFTNGRHIMPVKSVKQGGYKSFGNTVNDTVGSNDTLEYFFLIDHTFDINPYLTVYIDSIGTADTSVIVKLFQSVIGNQAQDAGDFISVKKGASLTDYADTLSLNTYYDISFKRDTAFFEGKYLKVMFIGLTKTGLKGDVRGSLKINVN